MRLTRGSLGNTDSGVLLLPIEVSVRELEAKLVLAARVAQRGMTVVIGHKESVNQFAKLKCPPGAVYLAKSVPRPGVDDVWEIIRGRALRCLAQDEEAGLQNEFFADVLRKSPALSRLSHLHAYLWR